MYNNYTILVLCKLSIIELWNHVNVNKSKYLLKYSKYFIVMFNMGVTFFYKFPLYPTSHIGLTEGTYC